MGRCWIASAVRRASVLAALLALVGAAAGAHGEARPAPRAPRV